MEREWNKKERILKVKEIKEKHTLNPLIDWQVFLTNSGFMVLFLGEKFFDKWTAYYVDKNYKETLIGDFDTPHDLHNIMEKMEKFRFEVEGENKRSLNEG